MATEDGYRLAYDPGIAKPFETLAEDDIDLWQVWDALGCPILTMRGAESQVLLSETAQEMTSRGPQSSLVEIAGCGHAPWLKATSEIEVVRDWLNDRQA